MLNQKLTGAGTNEKTYVEDVFSTYLYTGNGSTQTINNGIDLAGKGGMVWIKSRSAASGNCLYDTARGSGKVVFSQSTAAQYTAPAGNDLSAFNSNGFSLGSDYYGSQNASGATFASWTFRKAPKFFDVVTYTGDGVAGRQISHSLGQAPGMIIVKRTDSTSSWVTYHRSTGATNVLYLNLTNAAASSSLIWNDTEPTTTNFTVGAAINVSGATYVAYLFAHDTTADGLIQCGSFTSTSSGFSEVNLGWEPQYILFKRTDNIQNWYVWDVMRGMALTSSKSLSPNLADAEYDWASTSYVYPTATGFAGSGNFFGNGANVVYMAIRRPMKTPTDGTKVFQPVVRTGSGTTSVVNTTITPDLIVHKSRGSVTSPVWLDRLRDNYMLFSDSVSGTNAETLGSTSFPVSMWDNQTGYDITGTAGIANSTSYSYIDWAFKRAPGFFDVVCWTGDGTTNQQIKHNLSVEPELIICKKRSSTGNWAVYSKSTGIDYYAYLNTTGAFSNFANIWGSTTPTATTFNIRGPSLGIASGDTVVSYLFASCPGVSKVGTYTGSLYDQLLDCGFTNGARFIMIKRTDSTGDWYVYDTARGIVDGADKSLLLNSTAAEVTTNDWVHPYPTGIDIFGNKPISVPGATYIYLAIA